MSAPPKRSGPGWPWLTLADFGPHWIHFGGLPGPVVWVVHGLVYHYIPCVSFYVLCVPECVKKARTMVHMCIFMYPHVLSHIPMYFIVFRWIAIRWIGCIFMYVHFLHGILCIFMHLQKLSCAVTTSLCLFTYVHVCPCAPRACSPCLCAFI